MRELSLAKVTESSEEKMGIMKQKGNSENSGVGSTQPNFAGFEDEWSHIQRTEKQLQPRFPIRKSDPSVLPWQK